MSGPWLHLFNPENDLALGLGVSHYTPPPVAAALHRAGGLLPAWWSHPGDAQLVTGEGYETDAEWLQSRWGIEAHPVTSASVNHRPAPWGWSTDAARQFAEAGISAKALPTVDTLAHYRRLSHRRSSIAILEALGMEPDMLPREFTDADSALEAELSDRGCYFKSPWSCSGRGVFCARSMSKEALHGRISGIIRRQGSVIVERGFSRQLDFAALFYADGNVSFKGVSVFTTGRDGAYGGNLVAPQSRLRSLLWDAGAAQELEVICSRLETILTGFVRGYHGWLGVDMMIHTEADGHRAIHPCIELNLRTTMGVAAMAIAEVIGRQEPQLMGWHTVTPDVTPAGELLLPQRDGFALTLTPWHP